MISISKSSTSDKVLISYEIIEESFFIEGGDRLTGEQCALIKEWITRRLNAEWQARFKALDGSMAERIDLAQDFDAGAAATSAAAAASGSA